MLLLLLVMLIKSGRVCLSFETWYWTLSVYRSTQEVGDSQDAVPRLCQFSCVWCELARLCVGYMYGLCVQEHGVDKIYKLEPGKTLQGCEKYVYLHLK